MSTSKNKYLSFNPKDYVSTVQWEVEHVITPAWDFINIQKCYDNLTEIIKFYSLYVSKSINMFVAKNVICSFSTCITKNSKETCGRDVK